MKTLIVYDSFYGNTEQIALAISNSIGDKDYMAALRVNEVKPEHFTGLDLLIVGSPTRAFKSSKDITNLLNKIPDQSLVGVNVMAFDTRISVTNANSRLFTVLARFFGYAAKPIADRLVAKGGALLAPPEGFIVMDSKGPLQDGELERATEWTKLALKTK